MPTATDRQLVVHHDDLGGSHAANLAFVELSELGVVTSGSVMVPCPWFPEMAAIARQRPDLDIGVHLTLTSEFPGFRWRPLTGVAPNGLTDGDGFFGPRRTKRALPTRQRWKPSCERRSQRLCGPVST